MRTLTSYLSLHLKECGLSSGEIRTVIQKARPEIDIIYRDPNLWGCPESELRFCQKAFAFFTCANTLEEVYGTNRITLEFLNGYRKYLTTNPNEAIK